MAPGELAVCGTEACRVRLSMKDVLVDLTDTSMLLLLHTATLFTRLLLFVADVRDAEDELEDEALLMLEVRAVWGSRPFLDVPLL